jgi:hypothetical protein
MRAFPVCVGGLGDLTNSSGHSPTQRAIDTIHFSQLRRPATPLPWTGRKTRVLGACVSGKLVPLDRTYGTAFR